MITDFGAKVTGGKGYVVGDIHAWNESVERDV